MGAFRKFLHVIAVRFKSVGFLGNSDKFFNAKFFIGQGLGSVGIINLPLSNADSGYDLLLDDGATD